MTISETMNPEFSRIFEQIRLSLIKKKQWNMMGNSCDLSQPILQKITQIAYVVHTTSLKLERIFI